MHLLVLSAFRLIGERLAAYANAEGLNAPFGAQCFPTMRDNQQSLDFPFSLNAPFGAQCFPTPYRNRAVQ